jgi:putative transcriptional regulator
MVMIVNDLPRLMRARGLSIRELCRRTGITYTTVRAVYHGERRSVQYEVLDAICEALQVQPGELLHYAPDGTPDQEMLSPAQTVPAPEPVSESGAPGRPPAKSRLWNVWE